MEDRSNQLVGMRGEMTVADDLLIVELDDRQELSILLLDPLLALNIYRCTVNDSCNTVSGCT